MAPPIAQHLDPAVRALPVGVSDASIVDVRAPADATVTTVTTGEGVALPAVSVDALRLVAIVAGEGPRYAMVMAPGESTATVLHAGDRVGAGEVRDPARAWVWRWRVGRIERARVTRDARGMLTEVPARVVLVREAPPWAGGAVEERAMELGAPSSTR